MLPDTLFTDTLLTDTLITDTLITVLTVFRAHHVQVGGDIISDSPFIPFDFDGDGSLEWSFLKDFNPDSGNQSDIIEIP